ncbi:hypothetical protein BKA80DRAFT_131122 [Phyllosticta citrichinensis]
MGPHGKLSSAGTPRRHQRIDRRLVVVLKSRGVEGAPGVIRFGHPPGRVKIGNWPSAAASSTAFSAAASRLEHLLLQPRLHHMGILSPPPPIPDPSPLRGPHDAFAGFLTLSILFLSKYHCHCLSSVQNRIDALQLRQLGPLQPLHVVRSSAEATRKPLTQL